MEVLKGVDLSPNETCARITVMQSGGMLTDMQLRCENETFLAHKIIVAASSSYLQDVFKHEEGGGTGGLFTILMQDIKPVDVKNILHYIYAGEVRIQSSESDGFLRAAQHLRIDKILMNKKNMLKTQKTVKDVQAVHSTKPYKKMKKKDMGVVKVEPAESTKKGKKAKTENDKFSPKKVPNSCGQFEKITDHLKETKTIKKEPHLELIERHEKFSVVGRSRIEKNCLLPSRLANLIETSKPRAPSPHPKLSPENRPKVFYIAPLVKKFQITIPEKHENVVSKQSVLKKGRSTEHVIDKDMLEKSLLKCEPDHIGTFRQPLEVKTRPKKPKKSPKVNSANSAHLTGSDKGSSGSGKPNPRLNESLCAKDLSRTTRKAWFRRELEDDVSAIPADDSDSLIRAPKK